MTRLLSMHIFVTVVTLTSQVAIADAFSDWSRDYEPIYRGYSCGDANLFGETEDYVFILVSEETLDEEGEVHAALVNIDEREYPGLAEQEGLDFRVDFGSEQSESTQYAIVIQNDGDGGFYDFDSKEAKENKGYVQASRILECVRHEQTTHLNVESVNATKTEIPHKEIAAEVVPEQTPESQQEALSRLDRDTRQSIELACVTEYTQGPAPYRICVEQQLQSIQGAGRAPDLSGLDSDTRQSIELACVTEFTQGPAQYRRCVKQLLQSIGVEQE